MLSEKRVDPKWNLEEREHQSIARSFEDFPSRTT